MAEIPDELIAEESMRGSDVTGVVKFDHVAYCQEHYIQADPVKYHGFIIRLPAPYPKGAEYHPYKDGFGEAMELLIDLDGEEAALKFRASYKLFYEYRHDLVKMLTIRTSKTTGHYHVVIELHHPLPFYERVMLQACLGSDPKREMLHYVQHRKQEKNPILLIWRNDGVNLAAHWGLA